ncbi:HTTM domain-containing protein [Paraliomyxa miuraensis]|uniref:HTTM domain-containing protein n=1 Tax=Paraliomyxa miuraensis TaxID=376150 RepID=UPI00224F8623|nr:HTTM domain-containing protein [Paraliomyxa miuraensis]MCX4242425.1 HTTM domain-containing protein [Paraliomyxa miuraensis]
MASAWTRGWASVDRLLGRAMLDDEDPTALGLCRIAVVAVMTASMLTHLGAVSDYFSSHATIGGAAAREAFHSRWSLFFTIGEPWAVRTVFGIGVLAHVMWMVGLYTRVVSVIAWVVWISMVGRQPLLYALPDQLHTALATILMVVPAGRGLSLDARWRGKGGRVPVWCRRVLQLQIAVVYVSTGALKTGETWREQGTALYYTLANPYNRHFVMDRALALVQPWVLRPMTWAVLVYEVGFGGFVLLHWLRELLGRPRRFPDLRKPFLGFGVLMHLGIQALLYVAWFTPMMLAAYTVFLSPDEVKTIGAWLRRRSPEVPASDGEQAVQTARSHSSSAQLSASPAQAVL